MRRFVLATQVFLLFLGVSLRIVVQISVFCVRDTGFSAILGVSLQVAVRNAGFCVRDIEFSAVLGVSLHGKVQIAGRDTDAGWRWLGRCCLVAGMAVVLVLWQSVSLVVSLVVWRAVRLRVP